MIWRRMMTASLAVALTGIGSMSLTANESVDGPLVLKLRARGKDASSAPVSAEARWAPEKTALILCDMWDDHWCASAARRVGEMAGPLNDTIRVARERGVRVIHAPSSVVDFYKSAPQRRRASDAPFAKAPTPLSTVAHA